MILSEEQRKNGAKYRALNLLMRDIYNDRYNELQQLYEALNLKNNKELLEKLDEERNIGINFEKMIYVDTLLVIADFIDVRSEIDDMFRHLYEKRYPHAAKIFNEIDNNFQKTGSVFVSKRFEFSPGEADYFYYLVYSSGVFDDPEKYFPTINYKEDMNGLYNAYYLTDKNYYDDQLCFDGEEQTIIESIFFKKYLKKRRLELAEYAGVDETDLDEYIHSLMKSNSVNGKSERKNGFIAIIEDCARDVIANQNGGIAWYNNMTTTSDTDDYFKSEKYVPDVKHIIANYYKSVVVKTYVEKMQKKEPFNKLTLSRECLSGSVELDFHIILCIYEMDVLYKMFSIMMHQYYKDFSWEKITNQGIVQRYEKIIDNIERIIREKENTIQSLSRKNENLAVELTVQKSKDTSVFVVENNKMMKQLEEKELEIEKLKQQLKWQEEFIAELSQPEKECQEKIYNLEELQKHRYLFVGEVDNFPELKHLFPNSIFMDKKTTNISGIEVDAVVMLIRYMSHGMFYKIKASDLISHTSHVMCNSKSLDGILQNMYGLYE